MAEPFLGEIRVFGFAFAPQGWALCNGASMPIQQNAALNSLLGLYYGGDNRTYFNLPDLRGRTPVYWGSFPDTRENLILGQKGGAETVTLTSNNCPEHDHAFQATSAVGTVQNPAAPAAAGKSIYAQEGDSTPTNLYANYDSTKEVALAPSTIGVTGGGAGHNNMQPFAVVNFCIATIGNYPPHQ
ncbi:MAG: phage tail protein [Magnetococcales bacterium]|nr:phage tail protein [Magnetococcales bacterium]